MNEKKRDWKDKKEKFEKKRLTPYKKKDIRVRMTPEDKELLVAYAKLSGYSQSDIFIIGFKELMKSYPDGKGLPID